MPARAYVRDVTTAIDEQWRSTGRQKRSYLHHRGEFLHNYYMFDSVYDDDHDGVVRIFVGLSCEPGRLISYLINYIIIYIMWNNFSPTRSVIR